MTSKYGFSVVAPISVMTPSSTPGSSASCWDLLKRWISSRKRIVRRPVAPSRSRARASTSRTCATVAETAESSSNAAPVASRDDPRERGLAAPGRAVEDRRARPGPPRSRAAAPSPRRGRAAVRRTRRATAAACRSASGATAGAARWPHRRRGRSSQRSMLRSPWRPRLTRTSPSRSCPARASRTTSATCAPTSCCAAEAAGRAGARDELLFQTVHQSSELWLKLAPPRSRAATEHCSTRASSPPRCACSGARSLCLQIRHARSSTCSSRCRRGSTRPSRRVLGHGSGFDSPGFARCAPASRRRSARRSMPRVRRRPALDLVEVYVQGRRTRSSSARRGAASSGTSGSRRCGDPPLQGRRARSSATGRRHAGRRRSRCSGR